MPRIHAHALPADSALSGFVAPGDFIDCYAAAGDLMPRRAAEVIVRFPGWARVLVRLRRVLTAPFGLSQDGPDHPDKIGPFPVALDTPDELIAGFDDRHLNFRISVLRHEGQMMLATWARPHNIGGRLYLALILPFHILIARDGLARALRAG